MLEEIKVKSLYKALRILDCFTINEPELGITEISEKLGLYKSNVHNIVDTFVKAGYMEQSKETEKYRLGMKILELGNVISSNMSLRTILLPHMQELADAINETVYLGMPNDAEVIYLESASPKSTLSTRSMLGVKAPMYCTGIGKAMLAFSDAAVVEQVLRQPLQAFTEQTITDPEKLRDELIAIRTRGYSIDLMEHEYGIKCVGMPILNKKGNIVAGISVSGPSLRFDADAIPVFAQKLQHVVERVRDKF